MEESAQPPEQLRCPLSEVVTDCTKRWFQDTLKEAKNGDVNMQVILAQMYYTGYGVPIDAKKVDSNSICCFYLFTFCFLG